jgi:hypothetical protein
MMVFTHLNFLSNKWYCALCQSIVNDINDKFSNELAMEEDEENEDDIGDSWDFKRPYKHI